VVLPVATILPSGARAIVKPSLAASRTLRSPARSRNRIKTAIGLIAAEYELKLLLNAKDPVTGARRGSAIWLNHDGYCGIRCSNPVVTFPPVPKLVSGDPSVL
jgi:hypothetical protein